MIDYRGAKAAIDQFKQCCDLGHLVDEMGVVHPPPLLADWIIYVDGEKAARVPADNRNHLVQLCGPEGYGEMRAHVRVKPTLRIVR